MSGTRTVLLCAWAVVAWACDGGGEEGSRAGQGTDPTIGGTNGSGNAATGGISMGGAAAGGTLASPAMDGAIPNVASDAGPTAPDSNVAVGDAARKLTATDGMASDSFGYAIHASGGTAIVGAIGADKVTGAAYVLIHGSDGWSEQQKLTASDGSPSSYFGRSVAVSEDTVLIGSPAQFGPGAGYVFVRKGAVWEQQQKLTTSDGFNYDLCGDAVSVSGDTALLGAWHDDDKGNLSGSVYVFVRNGAIWIEQQKLTASDGAPDAHFGGAVSVSGDTALIGASGAGGMSSGAVYVFVRSGSTWIEQQTLTASNATAKAYFGATVSVSGDTALVGASGAGAMESGAAYLFVRNGSNWVEKQKLTASDAVMNAHFGRAVFLDGDGAIVGAPGEKPIGMGAAYVFARSGTTWAQHQKLSVSDVPPGDPFGFAIALASNTALVGAHIDGDLGTQAGAVYVFDLR